MKSCAQCLLPETAEATTFDDTGTCSVCRQIEFKEEKVDWVDRASQLDVLVAQYKDTGLYDCIVPFSGGKDSTYQLWYIVTQLKMKPLVVRFDHGFYRETLEENNKRTFKMLGVDEVYGLSVNDPFVMYEWGKALGIDKVRLLPDGNGEFTRKMGMLVEKGNQSCGLRSWRYAMFVEDGVITRIFVEDGFADNASIDPLEFTDADSMLNFMQTWREPLP